MTVSPGTSRIRRFGVFEYDPAAGELRKQGMKIKLQGQPIEILGMLLERPGEVVTREELQKKLWPADTFVDFEHSLNAAVKRLRDALDDSAETPRYIETLARRGYRFIAPVDGIAAVAPRSRIVHWIGLGGGALLLLAILVGLNVADWRDRLFRGGTKPISSIAVLPLANLSNDPEQDYFAEGMTEALITELGKISALRVISRQSMMQYKGTKKSAPQIAKELNVEAVVEGSVLRAGDRVRISVQLIRAAPERHLWADSYDRELRDILAMHSEMARSVANEIKITLAPQEESRLAGTRAVNSAAQEAYLRGRYFFDKRTKQGIEKALDHFQQAIEFDPSYAPPQAGLAEVYLVLALSDPTHEAELLAKAQAASLKALELDDRLSVAHYTLAAHRLRVWDWSGAEVEFRRAIELNSSNASAHMWYADLLVIVGRMAEANTEIQRAQELDPLSFEIYGSATEYLYFARRYDELIEHCQHLVERDPNLEWSYHQCFGAAYVQMGRREEAITELRKALKSSPIYAITATELAHALAVVGKREEALKLLEQVENVPLRTFGAALVHTGLGEKDEAFLSLEKAIELRTPIVSILRVDPRFDSLREDPRFQALLRRMNFPPDTPRTAVSQ